MKKKQSDAGDNLAGTPQSPRPRLWRVPLLALVLCALTSCYTASQQVTLEAGFGDLPGVDRSVPVEVVAPADASYAGKVYAGSGRAVALRIQEVARTRFAVVNLVEVGSSPESSARRLRIEPTLLHWENRNTPWSGLADEVRVRIELLDMPSGQRRALQYYGHSTWWTFVDDPPEDLLNEARFGQAVLQLLPAATPAQ